MLIGRAHERAQIERLLAGARLGTSGVLVVAGEPGIGKTALLEHAIERAASMGVLRARGVESEAEIPFAGLLALLRPALDRLDDIPPPQAAALRGALGLAPGVERDRFLIGAATLSLLAAHAERQPLLVAIDDAHWLDESSLAAILFAVRRLLADAVATLLTVRSGEASPAPDAFLPTLQLEGLDRETAGAVLEQHAGRPLPPGTADRLFEATLGNPLALVELAAAAADEPDERAFGIETSVERAFARRVESLPGPARRALALAAAEDAGDLAVLGPAATRARPRPRRSGGGRARRPGLDRGRAARLLPSARALGGLPVGGAGRAPRGARRARRGARRPGRPGPAGVASRRRGVRARRRRGATRSTAAGERARARSAYAAAANSYERAARLTEALPDRARRLFAAAEAAWLAGHAERAARLLEDARDVCSDPGLRLEIDHLRGHSALRRGRAVDAHDILVEAAEQAATARPRAGRW